MLWEERGTFNIISIYDSCSYWHWMKVEIGMCFWWWMTLIWLIISSLTCMNAIPIVNLYQYPSIILIRMLILVMLDWPLGLHWCLSWFIIHPLPSIYHLSFYTTLTSDYPPYLNNILTWKLLPIKVLQVGCEQWIQ